MQNLPIGIARFKMFSSLRWCQQQKHGDFGLCLTNRPISFNVCPPGGQPRGGDRWKLGSHGNQAMKYCAWKIFPHTHITKSHLGGPRCAVESHCCSSGNRSHSRGTSLHAAPSVLCHAEGVCLSIHAKHNTHRIKLLPWKLTSREWQKNATTEVTKKKESLVP